MTSKDRESKRIRLDLPVEVTRYADDQSVIGVSQGNLHDLSPGGCAFHHDEEIPVGQRIQVRILLNDELSRKFSSKQLTARGAIIRSVRDRDGCLISLRFFHEVHHTPEATGKE